MTDTRATTGSLVILGASERAARLADNLPCPVVHVAKPGGDVSALVRGDASYYSVDYAGHGFDDFAEAVLRPLKPRAVVSLTEMGVLPAARANETLGLPGTPAAVADAVDLVQGGPAGRAGRGCAAVLHSHHAASVPDRPGPDGLGTACDRDVRRAPLYRLDAPLYPPVRAGAVGEAQFLDGADTCLAGRHAHW